MDRQAWRDQLIEEAIEPDLPIVDAHHHLWSSSPFEGYEDYPPERLFQDLRSSGHNIIGTVYVDCHSHYRTDGPVELRAAGETEFADAVAAEGRRQRGPVAGACTGIVSNIDLRRGSASGDLLDAHIAASGNFRGVRHSTAFDAAVPPVYGATEGGVMMAQSFRQGFVEIQRRGLTFDAWVLHTQLWEVVDLARAFPETLIVLDHAGGPIGIGRYAERPEETFAGWRAGMADLARCPNVVVKLGGIGMAVNALMPTDAARPCDSTDVAGRQRRHLLTAIDLFSPARCMFETNFPVDMSEVSYTVLWNAFKRVSADLTPAERQDLFAGTAIRIYRLDALAAGQSSGTMADA